jgi:signal transduction histidine kinase
MSGADNSDVQREQQPGAGWPGVERRRIPRDPEALAALSRVVSDEEGVRSYQTAMRDMTRLNQLLAVLSEPAPLATVADRMVVTLSESFAADIVALLRFDHPGRLECLGSIGLPEDSIKPFALGDETYGRQAIDSRRPVPVEHAVADPRMDEQLRDLGVETALWLPVLGSQSVLGVLVLGRCSSLLFSRSDADLLMAMTYRIGLLLERAWADEERRRLELVFRQAEKAEGLARMAGAIAHHFNNDLTAVIGYLDLAVDDLGGGRSPVADIGSAQDAARQASRLGQFMLTYLGQSYTARETLDLVAACETVLADLGDKLPPGVTLRTRFPSRIMRVRSSTDDIRQILANLVANAGEAMATSAGEVVLSIREVTAAQIGPAVVPASGWTPAQGPYACLEVKDGGSGMDERTLENAFDPFFTTKFPGRGVGLSVVLGLVRAGDGTVSVESSPGRGSTFRVYLPLQPEAVPGSADRQPD